MLAVSNYKNIHKKGKRMQFYMNTGTGGETTTTTVMPIKPEENEAVLLVPEFKYLREYDFQKFNKFNFESDILDLDNSSFEYWWDIVFKPWLADLDERYLDLDFDGDFFKFQSPDDKKLFMTKFINFIMDVLPYQIMKNIFNELYIDDDYDAQEYIKEEGNLQSLRSLVIENINKNIGQMDDLIRTLRHVERVAKKNLVEENIALLDDHINENNLYLENFKTIIQEADMYKFRDFVLLMLINDSKNIL